MVDECPKQVAHMVEECSKKLNMVDELPEQLNRVNKFPKKVGHG